MSRQQNLDNARLEDYKHSHLRKDVATKVKGCSELKQLRTRI